VNAQSGGTRFASRGLEATYQQDVERAVDGMRASPELSADAAFEDLFA